MAKSQRRQAFPRIPFEEDLSVLAGCLTRYWRSNRAADFQCAVLAERVCWEKGLRYFKRGGRLEELAAKIDAVKTNKKYAEGLASVMRMRHTVTENAFPAYRDAGLL